MSVSTITHQEVRKRNLVSIARLSVVLAVLVAALYAYLGILSQNWYNFLVSGSFIIIAATAFLIVRSRHSEQPTIGVWHLIFTIILTALLISAIQANSGAEIGSAVLIIILVIVIQTVPPEKTLRAATLGAIASLVAGVFAFYSPFPQTANTTADLIITWVARGSTLAFLALIMVQFRALNIASKLLISFLGVVILISLTYNIFLTTTTTNTLTNRIGQQLNAIADGRGLIMGDYINGQVEILQTFALDETIRQSVRAANALKPSLDNILELDEEWRQAVTNGKSNSLINSRLSNSLSNDLRAFQANTPGHVEIFVTDKAGALISATNVTSDYYQADEGWWKSAYQGGVGNVYISQPEFDESANALSILIAVPIYDTRQGDLIGVLRTTISVDNLINVLKDPIGKTGEVNVLFPDETMLDSRGGTYENIIPTTMVAIRDSANQVFTRSFFEGKDRILSQSPVRSQINTTIINRLNWNVIASQDTEEALAPVREQVRTTSFFTTIMAGISALLSLVVSQRLARPIINLTDTAKKVADGDLNARALAETSDETGQLADAFNNMTAQLQETLVGLENRVIERTAELEESSQHLMKRAAQFETIAQLARTINSIQNPEILLDKITRLVSVSFGFYHVGLFLLDESRQYAVLSAANSEGGKRMLARKHRLGVGQTGIVGYVTSTGNPRIALDTGADAIFFDNPDLPDTHSEMALPLRIGETIVGALDVQSTEANAFSEDDVEVLSILADVVSVAIENARLFEESKRVLSEAQTAFSVSTMETWRQIATKRETVGYIFSGTSIQPLEKPLNSPEIREAIKSGKVSIATNGKNKKTTMLAIPIKLRDQVIGTINISPPENQDWNPDDADITQALAERVGVAIESAILLEDSRRRAARESMISDISSKISASVEIEHIMQVAVGELRQALDASEVSLKIGNNNKE